MSISRPRSRGMLHLLPVHRGRISDVVQTCTQGNVSWHRVAPLLARDFTVVAPDLRGYGGSSKPATTADHEPYSKRAMARDMVALMAHLGFERFALAGHDR